MDFHGKLRGNCVGVGLTSNSIAVPNVDVGSVWGAVCGYLREKACENLADQPSINVSKGLPHINRLAKHHHVYPITYQKRVTK